MMVGNTLSSPFRLEEGVSQGIVLSVTCFAVAIKGRVAFWGGGLFQNV